MAISNPPKARKIILLTAHSWRLSQCPLGLSFAE